MIPTRPYGKTGALVSRLGLGAMRLPVLKPDDVVDFEESTRIIRRATDLGISIFDSHHNYLGGHSETALAKGLVGVPRESYYIQTKNPDYRDETEGDTYEDRLQLALKKLNTDYIDFYLSHSLTWERFQKTGKRFLQVAERARQRGEIRHVGFSSHDTVPNVIKLIETGVFECMLVQYNYIENQNAESLAAAREWGLGTSVMGPLGGGTFVVPSAFTASTDHNEKAVESAFRFVLANENIDVAMSGMTSVDEVDENARIAANQTPLTPEERLRIEKDAQERRKLADLFCTGCGYCAPCPEEVAISRVFGLRNHHEVYGLQDAAREGYAKLLVKGRAAPACVLCGECEKKCPQQISIREQLARSHAILSDEPLEQKTKEKKAPPA